MNDDKRYAPDRPPPDPAEIQKTAMLADFWRQNRDLISPFLFDRNSLLKMHAARVRQGWIRMEKENPRG